MSSVPSNLDIDMPVGQFAISIYLECFRNEFLSFALGNSRFWSAPNSAESSKVSGNFWSSDSGSSVAQTAPNREKTMRIAYG
jgi:hypothetical protein